MLSESIEGHEWGTYVVLERSSGAEHGRAYKSRDSGSRSSRSTQREGCNGLTQTDCNVCRWLGNHGTSDQVRGRAGEGEQVIGWPATVRYARCEEPQLSWLPPGVISGVITGEPREIERLKRWFGRGPLEKGRKAPRWRPTLPHAPFGRGCDPFSRNLEQSKGMRGKGRRSL